MRVWDTSIISEPPTIDGSQVLEEPAVLHRWLTDLVQYGLARMSNSPTDRAFVNQLAAKIGPLRSTNFGSTFTVEAKVERDSTAYTGLNLGQHTDLPTRETPPGFQFLHCVQNTVAGGWSRMTDGEAIVAELIEHHPDSYAALTDLHWIFFNRSPECDHRWSGPMIDHGGPDQPLTLRAFYPVRAFPDMAETDVPLAYAAMKMFSDLAHDDRFQMRFPFAPGDIVGFDNRRVLHGRDAFEPSEGSRVLRGMYIDQDEVYSTLRVLGRSLA
jgi:gamma-butyrobetaine dioxygenase